VEEAFLSIAMWQRWPPLSWHPLTLREAGRIAQAFERHMQVVGPVMRGGLL
jgi:hypothetical protein